MEPEKSLLNEFLDGGWIIPLLGAASMFARLLSTNDRSGIVCQLKKVFVASLASTIVWALIQDVQLLDLHKAVIYGITGVISPEIIQGIVNLGKRFSKAPETFVKK
jgi:L-cysteine desulfidase